MNNFGRYNINASDVAKYFIYKSQYDDNPNYTVTPLKLQKLVYYAQAWCLALKDNILFNDEIQAWVHGPVVYKVYKEYEKYGYNQIREKVNTIPDDIRSNNEVSEVLNAVWDIYKDYDAKQLEKLTQSEPPWINARGDLKPYEASNNHISRDDMKKYYGKFTKQ